MGRVGGGAGRGGAIGCVGDPHSGNTVHLESVSERECRVIEVLRVYLAMAKSKLSVLNNGCVGVWRRGKTGRGDVWVDTRYHVCIEVVERTVTSSIWNVPSMSSWYRMLAASLSSWIGKYVYCIWPAKASCSECPTPRGA